MGVYETSRFDLDLDGSILLKEEKDLPFTLTEDDCKELNLDERLAGKDFGLSLLEKNLRTWNSMRDLLKRECMAQAPMVESTLVLTILIPVFFLLCIAHEVYLRQDSWFTSFNAVACLHVTVFTVFASEALLLCVDANYSFDAHNDKVAKNKESFLRRRRETFADDAIGSDLNKVDEAFLLAHGERLQVLDYVKYLHISNVMDTMIQKIETKDVPITMLTFKVDRNLKGKAIAAVASYVFTLVCLVAQQFDYVTEVRQDMFAEKFV
jgi:hypothetical protein